MKIFVVYVDTPGFHLVALIIMELKDHMICYKLECSHWWKIYFKKKTLQDFLSSLNAVISTNKRTCNPGLYLNITDDNQQMPFHSSRSFADLESINIS